MKSLEIPKQETTHEEHDWVLSVFECDRLFLVDISTGDFLIVSVTFWFVTFLKTRHNNTWLQ